MITAALPYANGPLHLGHLAGVYISADIYARFLRSNNEDVAFICGSDEHGAAITLRAKKEGKTPKEIVDVYHQSNKEVFEQLGISFDYYDRTSAEHHHKTAQELFLELEKKERLSKRNQSSTLTKNSINFWLIVISQVHVLNVVRRKPMGINVKNVEVH